MIVISDELVATPTALQGVSIGGVTLTANNPVIGYDNLVTPSLIVADSTAVGAVENLANPSTHLDWESGIAAQTAQYVTVFVSRVTDIDYVGIAGHNFGTGGVAVMVEGALESDSSGDLDWFELSPEVMPDDDSPVLFRFTPQSLLRIRIRMVADGGVAPQMAVVYVGKLLICERRMYVGHKILNYNTKANIVSGRSDRGKFLGRLVLGEYTESALELKNMTPRFYRNDIEPFRRSSIERPFFFSWRPDTYRFEVGYCWGTSDMQVNNALSNGFMSATMPVQGIAR